MYIVFGKSETYHAYKHYTYAKTCIQMGHVISCAGPLTNNRI